MSYGLKYWVKFYDVRGFAQWSVNIYESGYSGANSALITGKEPVTINYPKQDIQSPIMGSECVVSILTSTTGQYDEFLTAAPLRYYIQVYKGSDLYWQGVNTTDMVRRKDAYNSYELQLRFNDGLGELQWFFYEDSGALFTGVEQVIQVFNNCFTFLPYTLPLREIIEIREDSMSDTNGLLEQLYLSDQAFNRVANDGELHGLNCNQLINYICTALNCRIYQCNGMWYMERITERVNSSVKVYDYTLTSSIQTSNTLAHSATSTLSWVNTVDNSSFPRILDTTDLGVTKKNSSLAVNFSVSEFGNVELIPNPYIDNLPQDLVNGTPGPLPARWDRSADIVSESTPQGDSVQLVNPFTATLKERYAYCFGSKILSDNTNALNAINGFAPSEKSMYQSNYYIHAVQRPSDTYSYPAIFMNGSSGQLQFQIGLYFKITCKTNYTATNYYLKSQSDANIISNGIFYPTFEVSFFDGTNTFYLNDAFGNFIANPSHPVDNTQTSLLGNTGIPVSWLVNNASWITGNGVYPAGRMVPQNIIDALRDSYTNGSNEVTFEFYYVFNKTINLTGTALSSANGFYAFNCKCVAPWVSFGSSATLTQTPDYGVVYCDIQYLENAQSSNAFNAFYSAADIENRWAELDIKIVFADGVTNAYPGAWRLSTFAETQTWHNLVGTKVTGQNLLTLLFANFLAILDKYRQALTANMVGEISFQDTIKDTDGKLYMQTGHTFNIKSVKYVIDMEEMAQTTGITNNSWSGVKNVELKDYLIKTIAQVPISQSVNNITKIASVAQVYQSSVMIYPKKI